MLRRSTLTSQSGSHGTTISTWTLPQDRGEAILHAPESGSCRPGRSALRLALKSRPVPRARPNRWGRGWLARLKFLKLSPRSILSLEQGEMVVVSSEHDGTLKDGRNVDLQPLVPSAPPQRGRCLDHPALSVVGMPTRGAI